MPVPLFERSEMLRALQRRAGGFSHRSYKIEVIAVQGVCWVAESK